MRSIRFDTIENFDYENCGLTLTNMYLCKLVEKAIGRQCPELDLGWRQNDGGSFTNDDLWLNFIEVLLEGPVELKEDYPEDQSIFDMWDKPWCGSDVPQTVVIDSGLVADILHVADKHGLREQARDLVLQMFKQFFSGGFPNCSGYYGIAAVDDGLSLSILLSVETEAFAFCFDYDLEMLLKLREKLMILKKGLEMGAFLNCLKEHAKEGGS